MDQLQCRTGCAEIDKPEPLIVPAELGVSVPDTDGVHRWSNNPQGLSELLKRWYLAD